MRRPRMARRQDRPYDDDPMDDTWVLDRPAAAGRGPTVNSGRLWAGALATAVVAALIGLVGVLIVRAVLGISPRSGAFSDSDAVLLCVLAAAPDTRLAIAVPITRWINAVDTLIDSEAPPVNGSTTAAVVTSPMIQPR